MEGKRKNRELYRNTISYLGGLTVLGGLALIAVSMLWDFFSESSSPYWGMFTYIFFPGIVVLGFLIVVLGMDREGRRRQKIGSDEALPYPAIDLNDSVQRKKFTFGVVIMVVFLAIFSFLGYNAFHITESVAFCGKVCHKVMEPEYSAYLHSPHARVTCVECHVGKGAEYYVKSKVTGAKQLVGVITGHFPRPVPTPVKNLRPARETCEECHWPQKFYGAQLMQIPFFRYDEKNTSDQMNFLVKIGGGTPFTSQNSGIHWHMIINNKIEFAAADEKLQNIPYIKVTGPSGEVKEFFAKSSGDLKREDLQKRPLHKMDCMDCHNRPTHIFSPPDRSLDFSLRAGAISPDIPFIKKVAYETLIRDYNDSETARKEIGAAIHGFYSKNYPQFYGERKADIEKAVLTVGDIYGRTVFPYMKVDWKTYPENIGHRNWPGCFRCHDGEHLSADGKAISNDCTLCHTMPQRGPIEKLGALPPIYGEDWHPMKLEGKHSQIPCYQCHYAGVRPSSDCSGCHEKQRVKEAPMSEMSCSDCHLKPGVRDAVADCRSCHDKLAGLHLKGGHPSASCPDCHTPHKWVVSERESCLNCHDGKKDHNKDGLCQKCHPFK